MRSDKNFFYLFSKLDGCFALDALCDGDDLGVEAIVDKERVVDSLHLHAEGDRLADPVGHVPHLGRVPAALVVLAALVLFPGAGGDPEAFDASTDAAPGAAEPLDQIEGQGAEPDGQGGLLEPGLRETEGQIVED